MSKILIHTIAFSPDGVSTAYLYNDIALKFKKEGFEVIVLTTTPNFNIVESELKKQPLRKKYLGLFYVSDFHGITVKHVPQKKFKNPVFRILGFIYWHIISFFIGLFERDIDVILSPSPPLSIGLINIALGKIKKAKVIYNVQEIYPDLLISSGLKVNFIIGVLKWIEKLVYNKSDAVITIDQVFYNTISERFKDKSKLSIIPNFVDTEIYRPINVPEIKVDSNLFPQTNCLKVMYAGNIGYAQDWLPLIKISEKLKDEPVLFFVIGEGVMKSYLEEEKKVRGLDNIRIIPYLERETIPHIIAYSDLQFIFMSSQSESHGFPSKVYTIMSCAKPLLVCSGKRTPIINFLENKNCALIVTEKEPELKTELLTEILKNINNKELVEKGKNGANYIAENYSKDVVTDKYLTLVKTLI